MNANTDELNDIWDDLQAIFLTYKGINKKVIKDLEKLGIKVYGSKHVKMIIKGKIITLSSSPSDNYAGRQILRTIRKVFKQ